MLDRGFFARPVAEVAAALVGCRLEVLETGGTIVETEAYDRDDPASHSYGGRTARNAVMFGPPGHAYVYRSYGLHWCLNLVSQPGSAVLLRALLPDMGLDLMRARRRIDPAALLCAGPGRLTQALAVTDRENGLPLDAPPFRLLHGLPEGEIVAGPRIGISKAAEVPWRFGLKGSPYLSRRF